jgi:hypothetical protein
MRETPRPDLAFAVLPQLGSTAVEEMKIISTGSNRESCCKSAARLFVHLASGD